MAARSKLQPEVWKVIRNSWEAAADPGFVWLVDQFRLPVTAAAVRKRAQREGWSKVSKPIFNVSEGSGETLPKKPSPSAGLDKLAPELAGALSPQRREFVEQYQIDANATQAAIRAGYSPKSARTDGPRLLGNAVIAEAIRVLQADRLDRMSVEADTIVSHLFAIATVDAGEISQYRRTCCRHCWGQDFGYQRTPAEYRAHEKRWQDAAAKARAKGLPEPSFDEEGGLGFNGTRAPNPDCPECHGEGIGAAHFSDTRRLSPAGRLLFGGVEIGQQGLKVLMQSQERARETLLRITGLFSPRESGPEGSEINVDELERRYAGRMEAARERQRRVLEERGLTARDPED